LNSQHQSLIEPLVKKRCHLNYSISILKSGDGRSFLEKNPFTSNLITEEKTMNLKAMMIMKIIKKEKAL